MISEFSEEILTMMALRGVTIFTHRGAFNQWHTSSVNGGKVGLSIDMTPDLAPKSIRYISLGNNAEQEEIYAHGGEYVIIKNYANGSSVIYISGLPDNIANMIHEGRMS